MDQAKIQPLSDTITQARVHPRVSDTRQAAPPAPTHRPPPDEAADGRRVRELEALRRMAVAAADAVDADEIFNIVCTWLPELLQADFASIALEGVDGMREWCAEQAPPREVAARLAELLERVSRSGRTLVAGGADPAAGLDDDQVLPALFGSVSAVLLPLGGEEQAAGTLLVGWLRPGPVGARELRLARTLADQAAAAFRNAARYEALRRAAVVRERFFSAMSHDLRTPITAIVGYSELLSDGIMGELDERQHEMVERICQVSGHLSQLVNDILDLAKLDAGRMEFHREPVSLGEVVDEATVAVQPQARSKALELRLDIGEHRATLLDVDPPRVRQILVNLLSNAVKFTERGTVSISAGVDEGKSWITVADTGPGLPAGSEEAVFEEFLQLAAGNKQKREPGSGLGLAISRRLARAMGGDLAARNGESGGAAFTLFLPVDSSESPSL